VRGNQKYVQLLGDVAIPLLGFFFWNWGLYFIILFYLLDYFGNEVICHFKSKKILDYQKHKRSVWLKNGIISFFLMGLSILLIHLGMLELMPEIDFKREVIKFWNYKDMGIEQGYFLVPLVALVIYMRYKVEFIIPAKYKTVQLNQIWKSHNAAHFVILSGAALIGGVSTFVVFPEIVYVLVLVLSAVTFQLTKKPY
jgi:hypothetical protein